MAGKVLIHHRKFFDHFLRLAGHRGLTAHVHVLPALHTGDFGDVELLIKTVRKAMLQDLAAGRKTEADAILGPLLKAARRGDVPAPTLETLAAVLARLEKRLAK